MIDPFPETKPLRRAAALGALVLAGCSPTAAPGSQTLDGSGGSLAVGGGGSSGQTSSGSGGSTVIEATGGTGALPPSGSGGGGSDPWPSAGCVGPAIAAVAGEYCQGPSYDPQTQSGRLGNGEADCGSTLWGVARDFIGYQQTATDPPGTAHNDFGSKYCCGTPQGTVLATLGSDDKPAYNPSNVAGDYGMGGVGLTGPAEFAQWYNDTPGVNLAYLVGFHLVPSGDGKTHVFDSKLYFPVDGEGFGNFFDYGEDGMNHNFGFTTELHTKFEYQGGEIFSFQGDDDLWVFIDKKLAIDLGGIHSATPGMVELDAFAAQNGLVVGSVYSFDLFNAERHPSGSNFKVTTSMRFVDCGVDPVVR